jgi:peroxiredoxin
MFINKFLSVPILRQILIAAFLLPAAAFAQAGKLTFTIETDSSRIANDINARCQNIRSGKIKYEITRERFDRSKPVALEEVFEFSYPADSYLFAARLDRTEMMNDEIFFYHDTLFDIDHNGKVILFEENKIADFIDDYRLEIGKCAYGLYPRSSEDIFSVRGNFSFSDTMVDGDRCDKITILRDGNHSVYDSTEQVLIISKSNNTHNLYTKTDIGRCGNYSKWTQHCLSSVFSQTTDTLLLLSLKSNVLHLISDSGYVTYPYDSARTFYAKKSKFKRLKEGDVFPIMEFQTIEGNTVDISKDPARLTILEYTSMSSDPCGELIPAISNEYSKYKDSSVNIIMIDPSDQKEKDLFTRYVKKNNLNYPLLFSDKKKIFDELEIWSRPTYIGVDRNMKVWFIISASSRSGFTDSLEERIQKILSEL